MNKKLLLVLGATIASTGIYSASLNAATVSSGASANVLAPLAIADGTNQMNFGDVSGDTTNATTVILTTLGGTSSLDGANVSGSPTAADFDVTGAGTASYSITLPADGDVSLTGPGTAMDVDGFDHDAGGTPALVGGGDSFKVGATLKINADQTAGAYSGNYNVIVEYQ